MDLIMSLEVRTPWVAEEKSPWSSFGVDDGSRSDGVCWAESFPMAGSSWSCCGPRQDNDEPATGCDLAQRSPSLQEPSSGPTCCADDERDPQRPIPCAQSPQDLPVRSSSLSTQVSAVELRTRSIICRVGDGLLDCPGEFLGDVPPSTGHFSEGLEGSTVTFLSGWTVVGHGIDRPGSSLGTDERGRDRVATPSPGVLVTGSWDGRPATAVDSVIVST
jgi:hypothetical protein